MRVDLAITPNPGEDGRVCLHVQVVLQQAVSQALSTKSAPSARLQETIRVGYLAGGGDVRAARSNPIPCTTSCTLWGLRFKVEVLLLNEVLGELTATYVVQRQYRTVILASAKHNANSQFACASSDI